VSLGEHEKRASIGAIMLFQVCALFGSEFIQLQLEQVELSDQGAQHLSRMLGLLILALLISPMLQQHWPLLKTLFKLPKNAKPVLLASAVIGFLIYAINAIALIWAGILPWLSSASGYPPAVFEATFTFTNPTILILAILLMSGLTPIVEETINRGLILFSLLPKGRSVGIIGSALLFSVLHEPATIPAAFLFGVYAALQVLHWQTLWAPIVTHGVFNAFVQIDIHCIEKSWVFGRASEKLVTSALLSAATIIMSVLAIVWLTLKFRIGATTDEAAPTTTH